MASNCLATSNDLLLCKNTQWEPQSVADESHGEAHLLSEKPVSSRRDDDDVRRRQDEADEEWREERNGETELTGNGLYEGTSRKYQGKKAASRSSGRFATRLKSCHTPPVARLRQVNAHSSSSSLAGTSRKKRRQFRETFSVRVLYAESAKSEGNPMKFRSEIISLSGTP